MAAATRPAYSKEEVLGENAYLDAIRANADWFFDSGFILSDQDAAYYDAHRHTYDKTYSLHPGGDGRNGVAETYLSGASFQEDGSQSLRMVRPGGLQRGNGGRSGPGLPLYGR